MTCGYFSVPRGYLEKTIFNEDYFSKRDAWIWLVEHAAFKDTVSTIGPRPVSLKAGQLHVSVRYLAKAWGWDKCRVHRFLKSVKDANMIDTQTDTGMLLITICEYVKNCQKENGDASKTERSETETETNYESGISNKEERSYTRGSETIAEQALAIWNEECTHKPARYLTQQRAIALKKRLFETFQNDLGAWRQTCKRVARAPWLTDPEKWGKANIDWVITPRNLTKILEGLYDPDVENTPEDIELSMDFWRQMMVNYNTTGVWIERYGSPPGKHGCRVPESVIKEFANSGNSPHIARRDCEISA